MKEGTDFMLVDKCLYTFWLEKYSTEDNELKRFGIIDESGEAKVEIFLKVFNIYAIPNSQLKLDKFDPKIQSKMTALQLQFFFQNAQKWMTFSKRFAEF